MGDKDLSQKTIYLNGVIVGEVSSSGDNQRDMEAIRDFLKAKGLHKEVTLVQAIFRQALSFSTTASYLYKKDLLKAPRNVLSIAPFVVNSAFSIELYLKTLHQIEGNAVRGHSLLNIYDALSEKARKAIAVMAAKHSKEYGIPSVTRDDIRGFVAGLGSAFVEWRYLYEGKKCTSEVNIQPMILVMKALDEVCRDWGAT